MRFDPKGRAVIICVDAYNVVAVAVVVREGQEIPSIWL